MIKIGKLENNSSILLLSFFAILIIGFIDLKTSAELTLSIFYLIPIALHALYKRTTKISVVINSLFASLVWTIVIFIDRVYSNNFYAFWNSFIILTFFVSTGLLLFYLKKKHKKIHEINEFLKDLNEEKNKFIGIAAHDLRSPISTINSFSEILITDHKENITPEISRILEYIKDLSKNSLELLSNLLNISVIEAGKINIVLRYQNYLNFVKLYMYQNQIIADKKGILIRLEATDTELLVNFDEHYLGEVINNLLSNAIKFSFPQSEILIRVTKDDTNFVKTEIIDQGKGIALEEQPKLFHYFQTSSTQPTGGEKSTGLGLAIAKKIITEHKGHIGVQSFINNGANFYYDLPL